MTDDRIVKLDALLAELRERVTVNAERMDALRAAGREKSYQFREAMATRAFDAAVLKLLEERGISASNDT